MFKENDLDVYFYRQTRFSSLQNPLIENLKNLRTLGISWRILFAISTIEIRQVQNALWGFIGFPLDLVRIVKLKTLPSGRPNVDFIDANSLL